MKSRSVTRLNQALDEWGAELDKATDSLLAGDLDKHDKYSKRADEIKKRVYVLGDIVFGDEFEVKVKKGLF